MSEIYNKVTLIFVTQILFTVIFAGPELSSTNPTFQQFFPPPLIIFKKNLTQVFEDTHVVGYVDEKVDPAVRWPFELSSKIWNYVKETYGKFGDDQHLYVFLHSNETILQKHYLNIQFLHSNVTFPPNVVECRSESGWGQINEADDGILCLARQVSHLVMTFAKGTVDTDFLLSMRNDGDRENHWHSIFIYDFLFKCGQKQLASSYLKTSLTVSYSSEQRNKSYWMRDWFFPIYSQYGGAKVINTFFENSVKYFPRNLNTESKIKYWQYERRMTTGEFVHFWSGAANVNLRDQFSKIVNWDVSYEAQLRKAQLDFPHMKYLCPFCSAISGNNSLTYLGGHHENNLPKMTVDFKQVHFSEQPYSYNATLIKRASVYLFEPKFKNLARHLPVHQYDNGNPLYIVETEQNACYEVTCTSSYLVRWATNIPVKDVAREFEPSCGSWKYMNSRRLNDKYDSIPGRSKADVSLRYIIRFVFRVYKSNMGMLTCQNIANSSLATHYYFTDYPVFEKTTDLINFVKQPKTFSTFSRHTTHQALDTFYSPMELFWENSTESWFVVPCRGSRLSVEPNLIMTLLYVSLHEEFYNNTTQLWDIVSGSLVSKLQYDGDHSSALQYDPVKGFTMDPKFQYFLLGYVPANSLVRIYFNCTAEDGSKMQFNVYPFKKVKPGGVHEAKITKLVQEAELLKPLSSGCFYIRASDQFVSTVKGSLNYNFNQQYAVKLIQCSCPYECDIVRQCLDFQHGICYSERCEIQFASNRLVNPHNHGLLRCIDYSIEYGSRAIYEYTFVGLDRQRYLLSNDDVPTKAIIFLEETPAVLYTNAKSTFRCHIAHFILVANIKFAIIFENKTILELTNDTTELEADLYNTRDVSSVMNTNGNLGVGSRDINLNLTADVVGIMCLAPFHNSTDWANVTRSFITKDVYKPQINRTGRNQLKSFDVGDTDFNLYCKAHGAPHPKIEWKLPSYNNTSFKKSKHQFLTQVTDEIGNSVLKFPPMETSFAGTYSCYASNQYGNDSYDYVVKYEEKNIGTGAKLGIGFTVTFLLFFMLGFLLMWFQYQRAKDLSRDLTPEEVIEFKNGRGNQSCGSYIQGEGQININMLPFEKKFIINPSDLMIENGVILGQGHFGVVHRGLLNGIPVAVKTLKSTADVTFVKGLLSELKIMSFIGDHAHIIRFYGAVIEKIQKRVVEAVVELSPYGNLLDYLRKLGLSSFITSEDCFCNLVVNDVIVLDNTRRPLKVITTLDLIDWCRQIASGMDFISSKKVYHGDLAARNILMFPNKILKITDFGFAKQLYSSPLYVTKQKIALPWRWMSLESLRFLEFSILSDVWAFGVTMWEIFSLGQTPYPGLTWSPEFIKIITTGMRMAKPDYCSKSLYDQMLQCWDKNKEKRPQFWELVQFFDRLLQTLHPFGDTHPEGTMQEMNTKPTSSTSRTCSIPDGKSSEIVYTVL